MQAFKFLSAGAVGRFSDFVWPPPVDGPGEWVVAAGALVACASGIHACGEEGLVDWLDDELWRVELAGHVAEVEGVLVAERGRLLERIDAWDDACAQAFVEACCERARDHADRVGGTEEDVALLALDSLALGHGHRPDTRGAAVYAHPSVEQSPAATAANVGFVVAHVAGLASHSYAPGFDAERLWQRRWLCERLGLAFGA